MDRSLAAPLMDMVDPSAYQKAIGDAVRPAWDRRMPAKWETPLREPCYGIEPRIAMTPFPLPGGEDSDFCQPYRIVSIPPS